jgi:hypothetical protein
MDRAAVNALLESVTAKVEMGRLELPELGEHIDVRPVRKLDVINAGMRLGDDVGEVPIEVLVAVLVAVAKTDDGQKLFRSVAEASRFMNALPDDDLAALMEQMANHIASALQPAQVEDVEAGKASSVPSQRSSPS